MLTQIEKTDQLLRFICKCAYAACLKAAGIGYLTRITEHLMHGYPAMLRVLGTFVPLDESGKRLGALGKKPEKILLCAPRHKQNMRERGSISLGRRISLACSAAHLCDELVWQI